ncbi:MAG: hypothetical protein HC847_20045 [Hydrococcus sp. RU_2_2]|nr:hypothetical protein [Hydrococcus sp. RU_2_2]
MRQFVSPEQALDYALYGGEDFELVLCLPPPQAEILIQRLGNGAAIVGMITEDSNVELIDSYGIYSTQTLTLSKSFQHF